MGMVIIFAPNKIAHPRRMFSEPESVTADALPYNKPFIRNAYSMVRKLIMISLSIDNGTLENACYRNHYLTLKLRFALF